MIGNQTYAFCAKSLLRDMIFLVNVYNNIVRSEVDDVAVA